MNKSSQKLITFGWELDYDSADYSRYVKDDNEILVYKELYQIFMNAWVDAELLTVVLALIEELKEEKHNA